MALLEVKNLHTYFKTRKGIVKAVNDVSYTLEPGKTVGIVGNSRIYIKNLKAVKAIVQRLIADIGKPYRICIFS